MLKDFYSQYWLSFWW